MQSTQSPPSPPVRLAYLSKQGQVFGPYSEGDLIRMRASGDLRQYPWIWNPGLAQWSPNLAPPPAPPKLVSIRSTVPVSDSTQEIFGICHDQRGMVGGLIDGVSAEGCRLVTNLKEGSIPFFPGLRAQLNLLDEARGASSQVEVEVTVVSRETSGWVLQLSWPLIPSILVN